MGMLCKADGSVHKIMPRKGKKFQLDELQSYVGGLIEMVRLSDCWIICNEEGRLLDLPMNLSATLAYQLIGGDYICGDVVMCGFDEVE